MKIGILTFFNVSNYGAIMQSWALQKFLTKQGHDVWFVNHVPKANEDTYWSIPFIWMGSVPRKIGKVVTLPLAMFLRALKIRKYKKFVKQFMKVDAVRDSVEGYDLIVVGSDQVWNYELTGGYDDFFWGNAPVRDKKPLYVAYAASVNQDSFDREDYVKRSLENFKVVSVREKSSVDLISRYTDKPVHFVSDPTYLVEREDWNDIIDPAQIPQEDYLLIYPVGNMPATLSIGRQMAKARGLKVIIMVSQMFLNQNSETHYFDSPQGFISKLSGAKVVVTSSFHGTILSTVFNKDFYSVRHIEDSNSRASSLLNYLGLQDRMVSCFEQCATCSPIDYKEVNNRIYQLRKESSDFLTSSLN